jgi:hypothetical protein
MRRVCPYIGTMQAEEQELDELSGMSEPPDAHALTYADVC